MLSGIEERLKRLQLQTRYPVEHLLAGEYRSVFKGRGIDFDEIRPYTPGDEVRSIDWNVTARTGVPHIRRYIEERELGVWFLVDVSASCRTGFGDETKLRTIHEIVALLGFSAIRNHDRIGLILFSDRVEQILPPRKGTQHAMRLMGELLSIEPAGRKSDPAPAIDALLHLARRRNLVFLISDFLFPSDRDALGPAAFRHDLIAIAVNDPREVRPPVCGPAEVSDSETGETLVCDFSPGNHTRYRTAFAEHQTRWLTELSTAGADLVEVESGSDCATELALFFRNRLRRTADETGG